jgi:hypothetical protein
VIPFRDTPIETYRLNGIDVLVKREDECVDDPLAPRLAKLRGIYALLANDDGRRVGVYSTRTSHTGWAVCYVAKMLGKEALWYYPLRHEDAPDIQHQRGQELGARLVPLQAAMTRILYPQAQRWAAAQGFPLLPLDLGRKEVALAHAAIARTLPPVGSIVVATGSGMIALGLLLGAPETPIFGVSPGMDPSRQRTRIESVGVTSCDLLEWEGAERLKIAKDPRGYYEPEARRPPFPSSPYYDAKAWFWLEANVVTLPQPVLFYNVGA